MFLFHSAEPDLIKLCGNFPQIQISEYSLLYCLGNRGMEAHVRKAARVPREGGAGAVCAP